MKWLFKKRGIATLCAVVISTVSASADCVHSGGVIECAPAGQNVCIITIVGGSAGNVDKKAHNEIGALSCAKNRLTGKPCGAFNPTISSSKCPVKE